MTEQIYIHSKLKVVDDRFALLGSTNIKDRSLLGERDSEIAALVIDTDTSQCDVGTERVNPAGCGQPVASPALQCALSRPLPDGAGMTIRRLLLLLPSKMLQTTRARDRFQAVLASSAA